LETNEAIQNARNIGVPSGAQGEVLSETDLREGIPSSAGLRSGVAPGASDAAAAAVPGAGGVTAGGDWQTGGPLAV